MTPEWLVTVGHSLDADLALNGTDHVLLPLVIAVARAPLPVHWRQQRLMTKQVHSTRRHRISVESQSNLIESHRISSKRLSRSILVIAPHVLRAATVLRLLCDAPPGQVRKAESAKAARRITCAPQLAISAASEAYDKIIKSNAAATSYFRKETLKAGRSEEGEEDTPPEEKAGVQYLDELTGETTEGHPIAVKMRKIVNELKKRARDHGKPQEADAWVQFADSERQIYYYSMRTGAKSSTFPKLPHGAIVPCVLPYRPLEPSAQATVARAEPVTIAAPPRASAATLTCHPHLTRDEPPPFTRDWRTRSRAVT